MSCPILAGMAVTRRVFVSGAMATSLLALPARDAAAQVGDQAFTYLDGLGQLRLTDSALAQLATQKITVQAVAPATAITGSDGTTVVGITTSPEFGVGTVSVTGHASQASGRARGGVVLANASARMEIAEIRGSVPENLVYGFLKVNDVWVGEVALYAFDAGAVQLSVQPGSLGLPTTMQASGIPVTPTQAGADAFTNAFGTALFTTKDTVFLASAQGHVFPLPSLPAAS